MPGRRTVVAGAMLAVLAVLAAGDAVAAPKARLWERWTAHDPASAAVVDHAAWGTFLATYLVTTHPSGVNRLRYAAVTPEDRAALEAYVARLEAVRVSALARPEQMAFWINLYNAVTVRTVLARYPVRSIRAIRLGGLFSAGPWDAKLATVEGERLSLNDIEHRVLRPIWRDPRIHYAANCASVGCPNLAAEPYTGENLERLLEEGARAYVNHERGVRFEDGRLTVSSIYDWYEADFGGGTEGVRRHLERYAAPPLAERLRAYRGGLRYAYDWSLNE